LPDREEKDGFPFLIRKSAGVAEKQSG